MKRAKPKGRTKSKTNENNDLTTGGRPTEPFDLLKAVKLRMDKGLSYKEIALIVGVSPQSVQERMKRLGDAFNDPERLAVLKEHEPVMLDGVRSLLLERMTSVLGDSKANISFSQLALGYGIILDKTRLLRGQSTSALQQLSALIHEAHRVKALAETKAEDKALDITPQAEA